MDEIKLSADFKEAIVDWFTPEELVEFLNIRIEDIIEVFEDEILDNFDELAEEIRWQEANTEVEEDDYSGVQRWIGKSDE